ncbi:MAG: N-acetyltransferase [Nitrospirae bacterium]|nr:N-acetyltransferase [Nitrospirota bacterium]
MVTAERVEDGKDLKDFINLPFKLYENDPYWVPPLISDQKALFSRKNPFFEHAEVAFFIAKKNGIPAGRIAAIVNYKHIEFHNEKVGFFGFFETIHDNTVAKALFDKTKEWLKDKGMEIMRGPMNFSINEECGFLIEGFDTSPFLMMPYNPPYYPERVEGYGLKKAKDLFAYIINVPENMEPRVSRIADMARSHGAMVRKIDMKRFDDEIETFKHVYNSAWEKNWGFIPMTEKEIEWMAKRLKQLIVPELALIAEIEGKPAGFFLAIPDYNQVLKRLSGHLFPTGILKLLWYSRKITDIRVLIMGVLKEHRRKGIDALIYHEAWKAARNREYKRAEFSWVLEDNVLVHRVAKMLGARLYKKYRIYEIRI